ncbi:PREDICTED: protein msta [Nicrophorus vespilloides]|uniref:Protein msta n=1 Tax=Nicrophorus vespilloides TaxID=110193 RepID=A0ABM1MTR1_NICVS|nr:PREDICTED: protein msta [Nicrophorus vespilloides]
MSEVAKCAVCQKPAQQKCSGCHLVYYCSKEHQKDNWKLHKIDCKPFKISNDPNVGRHLIATRNLKPGDVILKEPPIVWGPSQVTIPVCLGCGKGLNAKTSKPCQKCGWPMCSEICQNSPSHIPECSYTVNRGDKVNISVFDIPNPSYQCITVLRCLHSKQFLSNVWKKIDALESHCEARKGTDKYEQEKITVVAFIKRFFKLDSFEDEDILRICGIIMVNAHEVPLTDPPYVAIFNTTSMFEHSCHANCSKTFTANGHVLITAGVDIKKGEHLSICYTDPLWGTANRRHHLQQTKFFWCSCSRCQDVTEFGTNFSALKCPKKDCKGYALPKTFKEDNLELSDKSWFCTTCNYEVGAGEVGGILQDCGTNLSGIRKGNSNACKVFISNSLKFLHPNHYYLTDVKFALSQLLGQEFHGGLPKISDEDLQLKIDICRQLTELANKIAPAENRIKGLLLFELHAAIMELGRRRGNSGTEESGPDYLYTKLIDSKKYLVQSIEALKNESEVMPEGQICIQARRNLKDIDVLLKTVYNAIGSSPI